MRSEDAKQRRTFRAHLVAATAAVVAPLAVARIASAGETWQVGEGTVTATGTLTGGSMMRTGARSASLLPSANATVVGQTGTAPSGRNSDDGDLNYGRYDLVSSPLELSAGLEWKQGAYGAAARGMSWYDASLANVDRPFGNVPNGYATNEPLGQGGFSMRQRFRGAAPVEANAWGTFALASAPLHVRAGWQEIPWGVQRSIAGGLGAINPDDYNAALRPGSLPDETKVPVPNRSERRYGRSDIFGLGPVNGSCVSADPAECSTDGYLTALSWGYRAKVGAAYGDAARVAVSPGIAFAHDVQGYAPDGAFNEGRMSLAPTVRAEMKSRYTADVTWVPTWGGTFNAFRDRSFAAAVVGVKL